MIHIRFLEVHIIEFWTNVLSEKAEKLFLKLCSAGSVSKGREYPSLMVSQTRTLSVRECQHFRELYKLFSKQ